MPYLEKLKMIKKEKGLSNVTIAKSGDVPLPTVTRVFNGQTLNATFETYVGIAKGMGISLDELAGLKSPSESPNLELLKEKDDKIEQMMGYIKTLRNDVNTLREDNNSLRDDNKSLRRGKFITIGILAIVVIALFGYIVYDLLNGHLGVIRYGSFH